MLMVTTFLSAVEPIQTVESLYREFPQSIDLRLWMRTAVWILRGALLTDALRWNWAKRDTKVWRIRLLEGFRHVLINVTELARHIGRSKWKPAAGFQNWRDRPRAVVGARELWFCKTWFSLHQLPSWNSINQNDWVSVTNSKNYFLTFIYHQLFALFSLRIKLTVLSVFPDSL